MVSKILVDEEIFDGSPALEGTRITVFEIVAGCDEVGVNVYLEQTPEVDSQSFQQAIEFCQQRACKSQGTFCPGCSLRQQQEGIKSAADFVNQYDTVEFTDSDEVLLGAGTQGGTVMMPGTPEELNKHWRNEDGWRIATLLAKRYGWQS